MLTLLIIFVLMPVVVGWYWTVGRLMTTLDIEPDSALGTQALEMLRKQDASKM